MFVVIGAALYFFTVLTAKERVHRAVPNVTFKQSMDTLKGNKPLLMLCLSSFFFLSGYLALTSVQLYYLRDVLGRLDLYPVLSITQLVLTFVLAAFMPRLVRNIGKKRVYIYSSLLTVIGGIIIFFDPGRARSGSASAACVISLVGVLAVSIVVWALEADTVEYGEWKTGVRTEGITYALFSFTRKTGQAVGGALAAYALALGGYKSGAVADRGSRVRNPVRRRRHPGRADHPGRAGDDQIQAHGRHARGNPRGDPGPPRERRNAPATLTAAMTPPTTPQTTLPPTCRQAADVHHQLTPTSYDLKEPSRP